MPVRAEGLRYTVLSLDFNDNLEASGRGSNKFTNAYLT